MADIIGKPIRHRRSFLLTILLLASVAPASSSSSSSLFVAPATSASPVSSSSSSSCQSAASSATFSRRRSRSRRRRRYSQQEQCDQYQFHRKNHHHHRRTRPPPLLSLSAHEKPDADYDSSSGRSSDPHQHQHHRQQQSLLGLSLNELSIKLQGSGRALAVWDCLRLGMDPNLYYSTRNSYRSNEDSIQHGNTMENNIMIVEGEDVMMGEVMRRDDSDNAIYDAWIAATASMTTTCITPTITVDSSSPRVTNKILQDQVGRNNRGRRLGSDAWNKLQHCMTAMDPDGESRADNIENATGPLFRSERPPHEHGNENTIYTIENTIATLSHLNVSPDGTTKLLLKMKSDGLEVESVIIPWMEKGFSTLCVSSQVGCRQGCTFCATGRMGKLRSLTTDEILVQVYYALKVCRIANNIAATRGDAVTRLPKVDNIVFMGMGEPADNAHAVLSAVQTMTDRCMLGLAQSKITISTVAPDPSAFATLGQASAALAWSVHAVDDELRRRLVPTTKYSMEDLRVGLVNALQTRPNKLRRTMLEVALIAGVNDSDDDAMRLANFSRAIMNDVNGSKVVVNLIPYNAIDHPTYCAPSKERVLEFQKVLTNGSVMCYVRTTRGDDESAACGQLATKKRRQAEYDVLVA